MPLTALAMTGAIYVHGSSKGHVHLSAHGTDKKERKTRDGEKEFLQGESYYLDWMQSGFESLMGAREEVEQYKDTVLMSSSRKTEGQRTCGYMACGSEALEAEHADGRAQRSEGGQILVQLIALKAEEEGEGKGRESLRTQEEGGKKGGSSEQQASRHQFEPSRPSITKSAHGPSEFESLCHRRGRAKSRRLPAVAYHYNSTRR
ncbi:hypothetical protein B0H17DRAFT_1183572 [Mycena rosella]|uniref:Uncharacterized protein n=1 Tax=Mycena rosella TaxID=1033263 RepID=A0AAD7CZL3_MYCRO|nr:hypothetical protein B0H17DRAFT_1183572 [Mycena rosella]